MGTNRVPLVADLYLFWFERDFMVSLSDDTQADTLKLLTQQIFGRPFEY